MITAASLISETTIGAPKLESTRICHKYVYDDLIAVCVEFELWTQTRTLLPMSPVFSTAQTLIPTQIKGCQGGAELTENKVPNDNELYEFDEAQHDADVDAGTG